MAANMDPKVAEAIAGRKKNRSKYNNKKVETADGKFDSKREFCRFKELQLLLKEGKINNLKRQEQYKLIVNGHLVTSYIADFVYVEESASVVEDCKGYRTPVYKLKKKLMKACLDIDIRET